MRFLFLSLFCLGVGQIHAQVGLVNRSSQRTDSAFLFQEVGNRLEITGTQGAGFQLKARKATITPLDSPRLFMVETNQLGPDTLQVLQKGKVVLAKIFLVVSLQLPVLRWGALAQPTATVPEVIANRRMTIFVPGCNCAGEWHIVSFKMTFLTSQLDGGKHIAIGGAVLTPEAIALVRQLHPGDKIVFDQIYVVCRTCRVREWPPFTITIAGS